MSPQYEGLEAAARVACRRAVCKQLVDLRMQQEEERTHAKASEQQGLLWGYIGILEKKMETTIVY